MILFSLVRLRTLEFSYWREPVVVISSDVFSLLAKRQILSPDRQALILILNIFLHAERV